MNVNLRKVNEKTPKLPNGFMSLAAKKTASTQTEPYLRSGKAGSLRAEQRREALRQLMTTHGLSIAQTAAAIGCSNSTIGNFLAGRTAALSVEVVENMARLFKVGISEIVGDRGWVSAPGQRIYLKGAVASNRSVKGYLWNEDRWVGYVMPEDKYKDLPTYLMSVDTQEMNEIWPQGSSVQVVDLTQYPNELRPGNRVIVRKIKSNGRSERVGYREIVVKIDHAFCTLVTRSTDPAFRDQSEQVPWPIDAEHKAQLPNGDFLLVQAVVLRSIREEL